MRFFPLLLLALVVRPLTADDGADSVRTANGLAGYPILYYSPETRWAAGAGALYFFRAEENSSRPTNITSGIIYTQNRQFLFEVTSNAFFRGGSLWHPGSFYFQKLPSRFFGIGSATPDSAEEEYTAQIVRINPSLLWKAAEGLFIGAQVHYEAWTVKETEPGRALAGGGVPGSSATTVMGVGGAVNYDTRDNIFAPLSGSFYQANAITSPEWLGSTTAFSRFRADLREYFALGGENVLSTQLMLQSTAGTVPFRFLPQLGGQNVLRGLYEGRYRDRHMAAVQAEVRTAFWRRFGLALFTGIGDVAPELSGFSWKSMKVTYGAGFRFAFIPEEHIILRIDFGFAKNSDGVYVTLNEAI